MFLFKLKHKLNLRWMLSFIFKEIEKKFPRIWKNLI